MIEVSSAEVAKNFDLYRERAEGTAGAAPEQVHVMHHNRPSVVIVGASEWERLKRRDKLSLAIEELPGEPVELVAVQPTGLTDPTDEFGERLLARKGRAPKGVLSVDPPGRSPAVVAQLRAHEAELRAAGICRLSLVGSVARGDDVETSDVDLAAEFAPAARVSLFGLAGLEERLAEILGSRVHLIPEPVENPRLRANLERDRVLVF